MIRLSDLQWERIRHHFPEENIADGRPGRRPVSTRQVLEGTLWILNTGAQWHMLPHCYPNYKRFIAAFRPGAAVKFCAAFSWTSPTNCANAACSTKKDASSTQPS